MQGIFNESLEIRQFVKLIFRSVVPKTPKIDTLVDVTTIAQEAGFRYCVAVTEGLMAAIETIPSHCSREDVQERLWDVIRMASLSARRAKAGCSRVVFEVILCIEGTTEKYQTLILNIRPGNTPKPVITIGFPEDFYGNELEGRA